MSIVRRLVPGRTHSGTRRTTRRCFFLMPNPDVNQIVLYDDNVEVFRQGPLEEQLLYLWRTCTAVEMLELDEAGDSGDVGLVA